MKRMKKILAILLAAIMVMSLGTSVLAEDETGSETEETTTTYTITINNLTSGYTYTAYQIFKGTLDSTGKILSDVDWGTNINTSITEGETSVTIYEALKAIKDSSENPIFATSTTEGETTTYPELTSAAQVAEILAEYKDDSDVAQAFAEVISVYLTVEGTASQYNTTDSNYTISGLTAGYYLVKTSQLPTDSSNSTTSGAFTRYILTVVGDVEVTEKADVSTVEKTVDDMDAYIGQELSYTLTATLPSTYADYDTYTLNFYDTLSTGLTLDTESVVVTVYDYAVTNDESFGTGTIYYTKGEDGKYTVVDTETTTSPTEGTSYYVYSGTAAKSGYTATYDYTVADSLTAFADGVTYYTRSGNDGSYTYTAVDTAEVTSPVEGTTYYTLTKLTVSISDTNNLKDESEDTITVSSTATIVVTYTATLNSTATVGGSGNSNKVYIEYSNDPNGDSATTISTTPEDESDVYTFELDITKVDADSYSSESSDYTTKLEGAEFVLTRTEGETTYYLTATEETTTNDDGETVGTGKYTVTGWTTDEDGATTLTSASDGTLKIVGLDDGTYALKETKAPDGYNLLTSAITVVISAEYSDSDGKLSSLTIKVGDEEASTGNTSTGVVTMTVENSAGSKLPTTGGIGTTIFYVVGAILVVGAAVILITRRRMASR